MVPQSAGQRGAAGAPTAECAAPPDLADLVQALNASLDGFVVLDLEGCYRYANETAGATLGQSAEQLLGRDFVASFPDRERTLARQRLAGCLGGQGGRWLSCVVRPDGEEREVEYSHLLWPPNGEPRYLATALRDLTEKRQLMGRITAFARIASSVAFAGSLEATLDALAESVDEATGTVGCGVLLMDGEPPRVRLVGRHRLPAGYAAVSQAAWSNDAFLPSVEAYRSRRPVVLRDARQRLLGDRRYAPLHHHLRAATWETLAAVPLIYQERVLGSLLAAYPPGRSPGEAEVYFLSAIADQAAVAVENARLLAAAQEKAALEERQRLARELHDSVSQALYGIALGARAARTALERDIRRAAEPLDYVLSLAEAGLAEMRALILELRPESLEAEGLVAALDKQVVALRTRHPLPIDVDLGEEPDASGDVKQAVYRIAQEALHNTVKHARATRAELTLRATAVELELAVCDDGVGFDPNGSFPGHLGLRSMRERAATLGGTLEIVSAPGAGTTIRVRIPANGSPA
jgi:PAS domain S-box-containing protein